MYTTCKLECRGRASSARKLECGLGGRGRLGVSVMNTEDGSDDALSFVSDVS